MVANGQRALWTFLIYALAGPFFAALSLVIVIALWQRDAGITVGGFAAFVTVSPTLLRRTSFTPVMR